MSIENFEPDIPILAHLIDYFNNTKVKIDFSIFEDLEIDVKIQESILRQISGEFEYWAGAAFASESKVEIVEAGVSFCEPNDFWPRIRESMAETSLLVDLGSGVRPNFFLGQETTICVELFDGYMEYLKDFGTSSRLIIIKDDVLTFLQRQPNRSIETIVVTDLIEHLSRENGSTLINEIQRVVSKQALIVTPRGFMPQHVGEGDNEGWGFIGNVLQNHVSGWDIEDFRGWNKLISTRYYSEVNHPQGIIGAIYEQEVSQKPGLVIVLEPHTPNTETIKMESEIFKLFDKISNHYSNFSVKFILPIEKSLKSIMINPHGRLPLGETKFASFNSDVNNLLASKGLQRCESLPGTVHYYLQEFKSSVVVMRIGNPSAVNYHQFVDGADLHFIDINLKRVKQLSELVDSFLVESNSWESFLELFNLNIGKP